MYKIEKDIPLPKPRNKFPFKDMEPGDSVFIDGAKVGQINPLLSHQKKNGKEFTCRTMDGGVRVWRVS